MGGDSLISKRVTKTKLKAILALLLLLMVFLPYGAAKDQKDLEDLAYTCLSIISDVPLSTVITSWELVRLAGEEPWYSTKYDDMNYDIFFSLAKDANDAAVLANPEYYYHSLYVAGLLEVASEQDYPPPEWAKSEILTNFWLTLREMATGEDYSEVKGYVEVVEPIPEIELAPEPDYYEDYEEPDSEPVEDEGSVGDDGLPCI